MWQFLANRWKKKAEALLASRELEKAAAYFRRIDDREGLARVALLQGNPRAAADHYLHIGRTADAFEALRRAGESRRALALCLENGMLAEAARIHEELGERTAAAELHAQLGDTDRAVALHHAAGNLNGIVTVLRAAGRDLALAAEEWAQMGDVATAAGLYCAIGLLPDAARVLLDAGQEEAALSLLEELGDQARLAEIHESRGGGPPAADCHERHEGGAAAAAAIYERLVLLKPENPRQADSVAIYGTLLPEANCAFFLDKQGGVMLTSGTLDRRWLTRPSGDLRPTALAVRPDAARAAAAYEAAPGSGGGHPVVVLDANKDTVLRREFVNPVREMAYLPASDYIAAATGENLIVFDGAMGDDVWARPVDFQTWSVAISGTGDRVAVAALGGSVVVYDAAGKELATKQFDDRAHRVRFMPDATPGLLAAIGDHGLARLDPNLGELWRRSLPDRIRFLLVVPQRSLIAVGGEQSLLLLNDSGALLDRTDFGSRLMTVVLGGAAGPLYASLADRTMVRVGLEDCRRRAAECHEKAGKKDLAAHLFRDVGDLQHAYELFREVGDFQSAAEAMEMTGDELRAARHYEMVGDYARAAAIYEERNEPQLAAKCYGRAEQFQRAAELYEKLGDRILAADFFERAGMCRQAGEIFAELEQPERAIENLAAHLQKEPGDHQVEFDLGRLQFLTERTEDAIKMLQAAAAAPEFEKPALNLLGQCFMQKGLYDVAIDRFNECLGEGAKPTRANLDNFYFIGCCHERAGRYTEAKDVFGRVMAIDFYYRDIRERLDRSQHLSTMPREHAAASEEVTAAVGTPVSDTAATAVDLSRPVQRYEIVRKLGEGGMGVVYLARDKRLNREVAWKILPAHLAKSADFQRRLLREARTAAQLAHPHIVAVHDVTTEAGQCSITMEYVEGGSLRAELAGEKPLPLDRVLRYARQVADAMTAAHAAGVTHRDLKPENVLVSRRGDLVKIVDFGLARLENDDENLTQEGCVVGTVRYMAPEQIRGEKASPSMDIYAFGIMLYEMLAGKPPFNGQNILAQHLNSPPLPVLSQRRDTPLGLAAVVGKCLAKDPDDRPEGFDEIVRELGDVAL